MPLRTRREEWKTTTTLNLGTGLARLNRKVLLIDADPQGSLTVSLGLRNPDELNVTLASVLDDVMEDLVPSQRKNLGTEFHEEPISYQVACQLLVLNSAEGRFRTKSAEESWY